MTFSEAVSGFTLSDVSVSSGTATVGSFVAVNASVYTVEVTPTVEGVITVDVDSGVASDLAGGDSLLRFVD